MKDIPGFEGLYAATEDGNVFSYRAKKFLNPSATEKGYLQVKLTDVTGKLKTCKIHRLVALTYIPNPDNLPEVDHIDRDKTNNSVNNLRWVTHRENVLNRDMKQFREKMRQVRSRPIEMRDKNNHNIIIKTYSSTRQAAIQEFDDVGKNSHIAACARGELKSAYGYFWTYVNSDTSYEEET